MPLESSHPDFWTEALQFTQTVHRDVYPAVDFSNEKIRLVAQSKVVLVTGAGSGFGKAACFQWAKSGAKAIVLVGRNLLQLESATKEILSEIPSADLIIANADVSSRADVKRAFDLAMLKFGTIDVVVHCAGVLGPLANVGDVDIEAWSDAFDINLKGTLYVARELLHASKGRSVTLIHAGTAASYFASPGQSSYTTSKAACNMLLDQLHAEHSNMRVFNVHPGMAKSKVLRKELEAYAKDSPELFGSVSIYLAGPQADFLRGRFVAANWDVDQLEEHAAAIASEGLLKSQAIKGRLGPGGHFAD